jgi:hypothetical protein
MVIMSMKRYEESLAKLDVYARLADAEQQVSQGLTKEATASLKSLRAKYHV